MPIISKSSLIIPVNFNRSQELILPEEPIQEPGVPLDEFQSCKNLVAVPKDRHEIKDLANMNTGDLVRLYQDCPREKLESILADLLCMDHEDWAKFSSDEVQNLVKSFLCFGWVCKILRDPKYQDLSYEEFNNFCRNLPKSAAKFLGFEKIPKYLNLPTKSFAELGFNFSKQADDNLCTLHTLNAAIAWGQEYSLDEVCQMAEKLSADNRKEVAHYFTLETGLSPEFRDILLKARSVQILGTFDGLDGQELQACLTKLSSDMCIIDSYAVATQFPNGLIARAPHSALMRKDQTGQWWLVNSMEPAASPIDFSYIKPGNFVFLPLKSSG